MIQREKITGRPAALLALAAVIGVVLADHTAALPGIPLYCCALALLAGCLAWRRNQWRWFALVVASLFALLHTIELRATRYHPLRLALEKRATALRVAATGRIEQPLRRDLPGVKAGESLFVAREIRCPQTGELWKGRITLQMFPGKEAAPPPGEYRVEGRLLLPQAPDNPGQFDARDYDLRLGLVAELRATRVECLGADRWNLASWLMRGADRCRAWITEVLQIDLHDRPNERAIILAMALGTIDASARELEKPFRESGTLHIFAVSGLHVVIVGYIFWALLRPFPLRRGWLVSILIAVLFGYAFVTGMRPSALRAAMMASVMLVGIAFHRRPDLINSLGFAALILIALDTQQPFMPGFQLSFFVLAAIAWLGDSFMNPFRPWIDPDPFLPKPLLSSHQKRFWTLRRGFVGLFTVSAAAAVGSLFLIYGHFHLITPVSLLANAVLVPLSFFVLGTAILTLLFGSIHITFLQIWCSNANLAFAACALQAAQFFAGLPLANFHVEHASLSSQASAQLSVLRLPAGAAAQHLRIGDRQWLLDTGSEEHFPFLLRPYLQHAGVDHLDGLILSHSDYEHIGATLRMQREFGNPPAWMPAREPWRWDGGGFRTLQTNGVQPIPLTQGGTLDLGSSDAGPARAVVLHPTSNTWPRRGDDRSLVLRLDLGPFRVLWCNDAGFLAEKTMLETLPREALRCDVLIRNQHASDHTLIPDFLDATQPRYLISSNDTFPPEQKLSQRLRDECARRKIQLLDQLETGAVMLHLWPGRMDISAMRAMAPITLLPTSR